MSASALQKAILALDRATTTSELVEATQTICGLKDLEAAPTLIKVLGFNNPAVGAVATQGLIALGRDVVPILVVNLDVGNYGARAWVVRAIATLRDPRGLDLLEHALNADIAPSVRRSATRGLAEMELEGPNVSKISHGVVKPCLKPLRTMSGSCVTPRPSGLSNGSAKTQQTPG
jgi:phycocyanobilin lyase beta subunit